MIVSGYKAMWVIVLFDLPTETKEAKREYAHFRKTLIKDGFVMLQYSVYARPCASDENAFVHADRTRKHLPPEGQVRILQLTDKQYGRMQVFWGKSRTASEKMPAQLEFF